MEAFLEQLKEIFKKIPKKPKFLQDLGFHSSYIGFRYFLQGHNDKPNSKFMIKLSDELGYEYIEIPIRKNGSDDHLVESITDNFLEDLQNYLEKYDSTQKPINNEGQLPSLLEVTAVDLQSNTYDDDDVNNLFK
jgi:hypothetical protein